jgi:hypothetical protein
MKSCSVGHRAVCLVSVLWSLALWVGAAGCGGVFTFEPGDGGDAAPSPGSDAASGCTPADCAGLGATTEAKVCPGGTAVGRSICAKQPDGRCGWDFPPCPPVDAAGPCQCAGPAPSTPSVRCSDGSIGGPVCSTHSDGSCSWQIRSCSAPRCPALGCNPMCANGVLKDANGCDTCQCAPAADGGPASGCRSSADCASGGVCGFREADGCAATGSCFPAPGVVCLLYAPGCACDGTEVSIACTGLPAGYASKSLLHPGVCIEGGVSDAGRDH